MKDQRKLESAKINRDLLDKVREIAKKENRPLKWQIEMFIEAGLVDYAAQKEFGKPE